MNRLSHHSQWYVSLRGGLGNRVMMLASLLRLHHRGLIAMPTVNWTVNEHCLARFDDLFQSLPDLRLVHDDSEIDAAVTPGPRVGRRPPHDPEWEQLGLLEESRVLRDENVQITFWGWLFHPNDLQWHPRIIRRELARATRLLCPQPGLLAGIVRADCLGVHARRTDRLDWLPAGADERLAKKIRELGAEQVFLATDAPELASFLRQRGIKVNHWDCLPSGRTGRRRNRAASSEASPRCGMRCGISVRSPAAERFCGTSAARFHKPPR